MSRWRSLRRHGASPAVGVLLGTGVAYLTNVVSSNPTLATTCGFLVLVLTWAAWEVWRAARARAAPPAAPGAASTVTIRQRIGRASGDASVTAARAPRIDNDYALTQEVDTVDGQASVTGFDGTPPRAS
jgi:hypothetical protein